MASRLGEALCSQGGALAPPSPPSTGSGGDRNPASSTDSIADLAMRLAANLADNSRDATLSQHNVTWRQLTPLQCCACASPRCSLHAPRCTPRCCFKAHITATGVASRARCSPPQGDHRVVVQVCPATISANSATVSKEATWWLGMDASLWQRIVAGGSSATCEGVPGSPCTTLCCALHNFVHSLTASATFLTSYSRARRLAGPCVPAVVPVVCKLKGSSPTRRPPHGPSKLRCSTVLGSRVVIATVGQVADWPSGTARGVRRGELSVVRFVCMPASRQVATTEPTSQTTARTGPGTVPTSIPAPQSIRRLVSLLPVGVSSALVAAACGLQVWLRVRPLFILRADVDVWVPG